MRRLKSTEVREYRAALLIEQKGICPLCGYNIAHDAVLDHCHTTGIVRAVLHRGCNALLGKIENNAARNGLKDPVKLRAYLGNVVAYMSTVIRMSAEERVFHPSWRTEDEKRLARNAKARKARARKAKA